MYRESMRRQSNLGENQMYKILIVEDDTSLADAIRDQVMGWGYTCSCVQNFQNVVKEFLKFEPHLVLLDIMLPFYNGYHWCSEIRKISNVPIIFISSASDNMNIVTAMQMGGDDFIAKPLDLDIMTAKIGALLRRTYDMGNALPVLEHKDAILNLGDSSISYKGERIELTKNEFRILQTLMENKGKIVSRETLMTKLWQMDVYVEENTLTVNVNRLRKKLQDVGLHEFITTKVGRGYMIE